MNDILNQDIVQNVEEYEVDHNKVQFIDDNRQGQTFFETQDLLPHGRETYFSNHKDIARETENVPDEPATKQSSNFNKTFFFASLFNEIVGTTSTGSLLKAVDGFIVSIEC